MKVYLTETEFKELIKTIVKEIKDNKLFLGYHASKYNLKDGYYKGPLLDSTTYEDIIRNAYMEIISDYDDNLENDDIEQMNEIFDENGFGFTYVSQEPIDSSSFQSSKYKYGDYLYEVYGDGNEILLNDPHEINADIIVSKKPLYFKQINTLMESFSFNKTELEDKIMHLHDLPNEYKIFATQNMQYITKAEKGKVTGLELPEDFHKSLKDRNLPDGFSVGVDKNGYFIHTHRARSKSHQTLDKITQREIKFIDSTD